MKRIAVVLCLPFLVSMAHAADPGLAEVRELGRLNGQALACAQNENIARIKAVMIGNAPKSREYGAAFEQATNEAFMLRSRDQEACQDGPVITLQVEELANRLRALFPEEKL